MYTHIQMKEVTTATDNVEHTARQDNINKRP